MVTGNDHMIDFGMMTFTFSHASLIDNECQISVLPISIQNGKFRFDFSRRFLKTGNNVVVFVLFSFDMIIHLY